MAKAKYKIEVKEDPSCEHCGSLEAFDPVVNDGGTTWCLDCAAIEDYLDVTAEALTKAEQESRRAKIAYHRAKLRELEEGV